MTDYLVHQTLIVIAAYHISQAMKNSATARLAPSLLVMRRGEKVFENGFLDERRAQYLVATARYLSRPFGKPKYNCHRHALDIFTGTYRFTILRISQGIAVCLLSFWSPKVVSPTVALAPSAAPSLPRMPLPH
ncbi:hypothetical protein [Rhizobium sp. UBA1881]|uniref:hypothetical protein n=1 Tax=Rhizobium sp. UBA1881 TaxID=1947375 RepID=UPI0025F60569|nr:hypothetical protein [Rhizobium sp. UBA1881]